MKKIAVLFLILGIIQTGLGIFFCLQEIPSSQPATNSDNPISIGIFIAMGLFFFIVGIFIIKKKETRLCPEN
jgi:predicted membrane channel-forming protein YqfA (hemolysin III family)